MSVDQPGPSAPKASINAPRAGQGPKRPPRPERRESPTGRTAAAPVPPPGFAPITAPVAAAPSVLDRDDTTAGTGPTVVPAPELERAPAGDVVPAAIAAATATTGATAAAKGRRRTRRGRRVKRVVRRIDLWSVLKLSLVVYTCIYLSVLATLAALWGIAYSSGSIERLQSFLADVGLDNFTFYGNQMFRACAAIGAVGVMAGTVITVLSTALVNVISEMTGGIRLVVIEEDVDG